MMHIATDFDVAGKVVQAKAKVGGILQDRRVQLDGVTAVTGIQVPFEARTLYVLNDSEGQATVTIDYVTAESHVLEVPPGEGMVIPLRDTVDDVGITPTGEGALRLVAMR